MIGGSVEVLEREWREVNDLVLKYEFDFMGLSSERLKVSPRAIEQGWIDELDNNIEEHRAWVSDAKAKALFKVNRVHFV